MKKIICILWMCLGCIGLLSGIAFATEQEMVESQIWINGSTKTSSQKVAVQVSVSVSHLDVEDEHLALSYHIYGKNNELLLFEGERISLENWVNGTIENIPVYIDIANLGDISREKELRIDFDIVNETGGYWFRTSPGVKMEATSIEYNGGTVMKLKESVLKAMNRPIALVMNLGLDFFVLWFILTRKKKIKL